MDNIYVLCKEVLLDRCERIPIHKICVAFFNSFETITPREKEAIIQRFFYRKKYKDIGYALNCGGGRANQIIKKGLRKLKHPTRSKKIRRYLGLLTKGEEGMRLFNQ